MARGLKERSDVEEIGSGAPRRQPPRAEAMEVTERDREVVSWVYRARLATREQVQAVLFSAAGRSRCQRRLTLLYRNRFIDKLPNRPLASPDVYYVSRRAIKGLRLLRGLFPEEEIVPQRVHAQTVEHTLDVASCRIALQRACQAVGYTLLAWQDEAELSQRMLDTGIRPDAYFRIERLTADGPKHASFFVEVERSGKAERALEERYRRYGEFYYDGEFERRFGARALRVLTLVGADYGINPERQVARLAGLCRRLQVTMTRFTPLATFLGEAPARALTAAIWRCPDGDAPVGLF